VTQHITLPVHRMEQIKVNKRGGALNKGHININLGPLHIISSNTDQMMEVNVNTVLYTKMKNVEFKDVEACGYFYHSELIEAFRRDGKDVNENTEVTVLRFTRD